MGLVYFANSDLLTQLFANLTKAQDMSLPAHQDLSLPGWMSRSFKVLKDIPDRGNGIVEGGKPEIMVCLENCIHFVMICSMRSVGDGHQKVREAIWKRMIPERLP